MNGKVNPHAKGTISVNMSVFYNLPHLITATIRGIDGHPNLLSFHVNFLW